MSSEDVIFQSSDLATQRRTEFLSAARSGLARLRDKNGTSLVMLPERHLQLLEELRTWSSVHLRLERLLARPDFKPTVEALGDLAWLRVFDCEDLREFADELGEAIVAADSDSDLAVLRECLDAWKTTARQLEDPMRRSALLRKGVVPNLVEAVRPEGDLE
ncbi:hypothetical protein OHB31_16995 [Streptomyces microflavus]|uniref:DUF6247 family protein n=1 Tax=Streptomyces TaxID=1883 RepID=UPI0011817516|nr:MULTISPECIES: DUF6247 family protein [Streptomyces]WSA61756.1 hypothetical protein OHB31_16995 [Streptomyces microflavus]